MASTAAAATPGAPRVMVLVHGSRGDIQPAVAFALALRDRGCEVKVLCTINHVSFAQQFGLAAAGFPPDLDRYMQENQEVREMMAEGRSRSGAADVSKLDEDRADGVERMRIVHKECMEFLPEVILYSILACVEAVAMERLLGVCSLHFIFQPWCGTKCAPPPMMPHLPFGWNSLLWRFAERLVFKLMKDKCARVAQEALGCNPMENMTMEHFRQLGHPYPKFRPMLCGVSRHVLAAQPKDWPLPTPSSGFHLTGFWTLSPEQQVAAAGGDAFGGAATLQAIDAFMAGRPPPIYFGWGSMTVKSPHFMAQLAVRALKLTGHRGVIMGGWAKLRAEHLAGDEDETELAAFAADHVLWLSSAPHEVLFPRCSVLVHHGGPGTLAAALRAGRPSVCTPVMLDQFDFSRAAQDCGAGVATAQLGKVTPQALASAIMACESASMARKAEGIGKKMRAEDGASAAAAVVTRYVAEEVRTGRWKASAPADSAWGRGLMPCVG